MQRDSYIDETPADPPEFLLSKTHDPQATTARPSSVTVNMSGTGVDASGIRERLPKSPEAPQHAESVQAAQDVVKSLNEQEAKHDKGEKEKKTFGRTPDGTGAFLKRTCYLTVVVLYAK